MLVYNKTGKIIGIGGIAVLPQGFGQVPDSFQNNPVLATLADENKIIIQPTALQNQNVQVSEMLESQAGEVFAKEDESIGTEVLQGPEKPETLESETALPSEMLQVETSLGAVPQTATQEESSSKKKAVK